MSQEKGSLVAPHLLWLPPFLSVWRPSELSKRVLHTRSPKQILWGNKMRRHNFWEPGTLFSAAIKSVPGSRGKSTLLYKPQGPAKASAHALLWGPCSGSTDSQLLEPTATKLWAERSTLQECPPVSINKTFSLNTHHNNIEEGSAHRIGKIYQLKADLAPSNSPRILSRWIYKQRYI